ncbi:hypothetical protein Tco_0041700 [Tanacetum coccineum]
MDHHSSSVHHGLADYNSEASSSGEINIPESNQSTQHHEHVRKWTDSHPLDNIIGNPSRPVSTRKQLATDALWCFYNSVLSKVEPKNFQSAATEDCWFQAMQDEIHEFDRLDVWELVPTAKPSLEDTEEAILQKVPGKGKEKVGEEQAAQVLLNLQTLKKKRKPVSESSEAQPLAKRAKAGKVVKKITIKSSK